MEVCDKKRKWEGGRKREEGKEGGREGGIKAGREGGRKGGIEGAREGDSEEESEEGSEEGSKRGGRVCECINMSGHQSSKQQPVTSRYGFLQHTATYCNTLQHCNTL